MRAINLGLMGEIKSANKTKTPHKLLRTSLAFCAQMQTFLEHAPREIFAMIIEKIPLSLRVSLPLVNQGFSQRLKRERTLLIEPCITILEDVAQLGFPNLFEWMINLLRYPNCVMKCQKALSGAAAGLRRKINTKNARKTDY